VLLQVLNLAGNKLRAIPSDVGWLGLKQLNISDNPDLNIPAHVLQCGFKCVWKGTGSMQQGSLYDLVHMKKNAAALLAG
jgi:hypothetical protein